MNAARQIHVCLSLTILTVALGLLPAASAQNPGTETDPDWHFRFELFQMLLEQGGLKPVANTQDVVRNPKDSVIVLMGNLRGAFSPRLIEMFCLNGGTVLMACDSEYSAGAICHFQSGPVQGRRSGDHYQGFEDCLKISNLDPQHPLTEGVGSLVVNRSGWLSKPRPATEWDVIARLPNLCYPTASETEPILVEVKVAPGEAGRLIVAADQSLFTNGMLWHGDNAILAINLSKLLCSGNRHRLLFVADGDLLGSYQQSPAMNQNPPLPNLPQNLPEPELKTMLRVVNSVIQNVEESNVINEVLANRPRDVPPPYYKRGLLFALAIVAALFVLWRLTSGGPTTHTPMPQRDMRTAHDLATDRKVKSAEFGLAASMLARGLCRELTNSQDSAVWQRQLAGNIVTGTSATEKKPQQKQLAVVLDLAVNTRTVHISRRRFQAIGRTIQELRQLHQQDRLLVNTG